MKKEWRTKIDCRKDGDALNPLRLIDQILDERGIDDYAEFVNPNDDCFIPFENMYGIDNAAKIVSDVIENDGRIYVFADT